MIFSRIHLRRLAEDLTSRYYVVKRETLFLSAGVAYALSERDAHRRGGAQGASSKGPTARPGLRPKDIDTGAVILTGEALRRENAQAISAMLSEAGGDLVCATAGHHMESMLAAYGSGAALSSSENGIRILNLDIGGGTTKLAHRRRWPRARDRCGPYRRTAGRRR